MSPNQQVPPKSGEKKTISGIVQVTRKGTGYMPISADAPKGKSKEDIEIFPEKLNGALNGDTVEVELISVFPRPRGRVKKIVQRAKMQFVCTLKKVGDKLMATASDMRFPVSIDVGPSAEKAKEGDRVLVKLLSFDGTTAKGTIMEVIGAAGEHRVEMNAIVLEHGFSTQFPPEVLKEAQDIEKNHAQIIADEVGKRTDFRNKLTFTIDPVDAKDYDDALSIEQLDENTYEIGVHIADVTHFVRPGTALDDEAIRRGTSVYLVDATIPMLPHELSGNVCSLKADEDRLAFSAIFKITKNAEVLERRFEKTIIRSNKRFTYEEAQGLLDAKDTGEFGKPLATLWSIAQIFRKEKEKRGAIDFGDNEVRFTLDENGVPTGVVRKERIDTNLLIEEYMLLANREVAKYVSKLAEKSPEKGLVFLYRIHDDPKDDRIDELATFVRAIGYEFGQKGKKPTAKDISKLLEQIEGKPEEHLIRTATLRTMAKAIYSTRNIGHFGLAFDYYTHFTSPIRRYPDVLVHRIIMSHLDGHPMTRREFTTLERMCIAASEQEAKAVSAERDSIRYKQVEYLSSRIGQEFDAIISGVTDWGLYVEDKETASEGLVRMRALEGDFFEHRPKEYAVVGQRTQKKYALG
ncbi:ribonuclease R, partial [Candidatus Adlerbacteria bacterium RIFOXYC1_FULL_48_26]